MNTASLSPQEQVRTLLDLPAGARSDDVFECLMGCLTDGLDCQFVNPARLPGKAARYEAAWLSPGGTRYEGRGRSGREAALAAAVRLISEAEEGAFLRLYGEPELRFLNPRKTRPRAQSSNGHASPVRSHASRRAGWPE